jgi:hypothetical protein
VIKSPARRLNPAPPTHKACGSSQQRGLRVMATTLRCAASVAASGTHLALQQSGSYGARASGTTVQLCSSSGGSLTGTKLQATTSYRRAPGRRASSFSVTASVAEAASAEVELSAEQAELLQRRKAIMQAEEQASGFVVTEVDTTGHQDWHAAKVLTVRDVAAGVRCVTLETEVSREVCRKHG